MSEETSFSADEAFARSLDEEDPLASFRTRFHVPRRDDGSEVVYLCGNSLGLQPKGVRAAIERELLDWEEQAVEAHFHGRTPWYSYHEVFREPMGRVVGARPDEVVVMNGLTVNLHLLMATFFRPEGERRAIAIEDPAFPSDRYAVQTHLRHRGLDPETDLLEIRPREGEATLRTEDVEAFVAEHGSRLALLLLGGVNYYTGQLLDIERITAAGHAAGAVVGWDLAHAAGNVPLALHDAGVDFAAWCTYKYLNAGPGAVAGAFVHEKHGARTDLPRLAGWWGNDPERRFHMDEERVFEARTGADGWQLSNPPILAMAPLRASLELFDEAGMEALREKSLRLSGYLRWLLERVPGDRIEILTPAEPEARGCQVSVRVRDGARAVHDRLTERGFVGDYREPGVMRFAPVPLYNRFVRTCGSWPGRSRREVAP
jgi:kynureninase